MRGPATPWRLGLTGSIGSGKSTVASLLAARGAAVIDADAIARATTAAGGAAIARIKATFGANLIDSQGALDRAAMRALVYRDPSARTRLEAIVHPLVGAAIALQANEASAAGKALLVFDIPLLVESGNRWRALVDRVLVIDCETETQITRVRARSHLKRAEIERIIAAQATRQLRLAVADAVVYNGGPTTLAQLGAAVAALLEKLSRYD